MTSKLKFEEIKEDNNNILLSTSLEDTKYDFQSWSHIPVKCRRALKRKLKKYRLRKDGCEDKDILDVSLNLETSLKIKSPDSQRCAVDDSNNIEDFGPTNYLFKMVKKQKKTVGTNSEKIEQRNDRKMEQANSIPKKKETNAFQLLMDSRNKSIGHNSPGKEKLLDESELDELGEKKTTKAKRNLALHKLAEAKGSLKRKEVEEYQEECIKHKMEKRAERLKKLITNHSTKTKDSEKMKKVSKVEVKENNTNSLDSEIVVITEDINSTKKVKTSLHLINMFDEDDEPLSTLSSSKVKTLSKEDEEFVSKLGPSIRKKESMLCYFQKVDKSCENVENIIDNNIIKVKVYKNKKKSKKKKLNLKRTTLSEVNNDSRHQDINLDSNVASEESSNSVALNTVNNDFQHKKESNIEKEKILNINTITEPTDNGRPKRRVKRPSKYIDDIILSNSEDEMHIFTPKKKKKIIDIQHMPESSSITIKDNTKNKKLFNSDNTKKDTNKKKENKEATKKLVKLAPIFASKPQIDPAALAAKQKFLQSGVPEKLKKIISRQNSEPQCTTDFPTVVHIQQLNNVKLVNVEKYFNDDKLDEELHFEYKDFDKSLITPNAENASFIISLPTFSKDSLLQNIKEKYPRFPVYRTYRLLKNKSKGEIYDFNYSYLDNSAEMITNLNDNNIENLNIFNWTEKYKPMSGKQIIGNFDTINELRKWLVTWTENEFSRKNNADSDSSDFCLSDTDSKDSFKNFNNHLILTGPVGCGKTSSVYAVAAELAMKVIEVNVSSKRTGKIMLQDLQEATQSHKVNRGKGTTSNENSQKSQDLLTEPIKVGKKRGRKKTALKIASIGYSQNDNSKSLSSSQESGRTAMSLILVDDADIIFDQDDGFCSAISQLIQCSKRPVILISSSSSCCHLQKFTQGAKVLNMTPLIPRMLGTWLDIMCLAENGYCYPGMAEKFLDFYRGDIRKAINNLQFYMLSENSSIKQDKELQNSEEFKVDIEDENSSMSWIENDVLQDINSRSSLMQNECKNFPDKQIALLYKTCPLNSFDAWWSIPKILPKSKESVHKLELDTFANVLDTFSTIDYIDSINPDVKRNMASNPWNSTESESVLEQENFERYYRSHEIKDEINHYLITKSFEEVKHVSQSEDSEITVLSMSEKRARDKIISRHHTLTSYLSPSTAMDHRALAMDYWSSCRTICRIEKTRTDNNSKRNNRFCHYLKSLNVMCKNESFDKLGASLSTNCE